jgi:hypothetical protein
MQHNFQQRSFAVCIAAVPINFVNVYNVTIFVSDVVGQLVYHKLLLDLLFLDVVDLATVVI